MAARWIAGLAVGLLWTIPAVAGQNVLTWTDNSTNETGFRVERRLGPLSNTASFYLHTTVGANVSTYTDVAVTDGTEYCYRVAAYNSVGVSAYTNIVCRTVPAPPTVPNAPSGLQAN